MKTRDMPCSKLALALERSRWTALPFDLLVQRPRRLLYGVRRRPGSLFRYESRSYSQNGEDGVVAEIFRRIGPGNRFVIEFGIEDGRECCSRKLIEGDWNALLIEGSPVAARAAQAFYADRPGVRVVESFVTAENIQSLLADNCTPRQPDLLVIDIDGNDYWVLAEVLQSYRPRVIVSEYNGRWPPPVEWIMPYDPTHSWDYSAYYGASLTSLAKLLHRYDYKLVACESMGVNAFFVRSDVAGQHLAGEIGNARQHYVPPHHTRGFGQPVWPRFSAPAS